MTDSDNRAVKILVVDRDVEAARRIQSALLGEGFCCEHSVNAAGALTQARQELPALMIVDAQLDACSGFEFARTVQNEYPQHDIPVIFVSESRSDGLVEESRDAGGIYFLSKPIDPSVLLDLVDKALWMPHLIRRHIDSKAHASIPKAPRVLADRKSPRTKHLFS